MKVSIWKVVAGLVLIALLVGAGGMIYRAGYARGMMSEMSFEDMPFAEGGFENMPFARGGYDGMMPYGGMPYMRGSSGYTGFHSIGGMLFGGFVFLLIIGGFFRFFGMRRYGYGMPPWAMHKMGYHGEGTPPWMRHHPYWGKNPEGDDENEEESKE